MMTETTALGVHESVNHKPVPVRGTIRRAKDGKRLSHPIRASDHPILADCGCGKIISKAALVCADWGHIENDR
jgi:hypothetical protein